MWSRKDAKAKITNEEGVCPASSGAGDKIENSRSDISAKPIVGGCDPKGQIQPSSLHALTHLRAENN
jgi:hypothetical protein